MQFREFDVAPRLAQHVSRYWTMDVATGDESHRHQVLPDACIALIVALRRDGTLTMTLQGPRLEPLWIPVFPGDRFLGARFWPDAGSGMVGKSALSLRDIMVPAASVLGPACMEAARCIAGSHDATEVAAEWNAFLLALREPLPPLDVAVRTVVQAIIAARGAAPLSELSESVCLTDRQLQRRFKAAVGLTMKQYARVRRLRSTLTHLVEQRRMTWSEVAAEFGFADHAHLIREFSALSGVTPSEVAARVARIGHEGVRP